MGIGVGSVRLHLELWQRGIFDNVDSVLELGSQELHLTKTVFEDLIQASGMTHYDETPFMGLADYPNAKYISTKPFYELLGASRYSSIDINGEHGAIRHDLNYPFIDSSLFGQYDLVTDHGSNEHVFNVVEAYRTMHQFCKQGGKLLITQALYGGNGYFNFDPSFFEGLAAANGYRILYSSFLLTTKNDSALGHTIKSGQYHIPIYRELLNAFDYAKLDYVELCYVFEKLSEDDFRYPYQAELDTKMNANFGYQLQFLSHPPSRTYVPVRNTWMKDELLMSVRFPELVRHLFRRFTKKMKSKVGL